MIDRIFNAMERRSTGNEAKRAAHGLQFLSAWLFAALGLLLAGGWLRVLFCSEALGAIAARSRRLADASAG